jgi:hypothetical protein
MVKNRYLSVGGLVALGFDQTGQYLLAVSHSARGVFAVGTWQKVARDTELAYPEDGKAIGIGPISGQIIAVMERSRNCEQINMISPDGGFRVLGESDGITISETVAPM